MFSLIKARFLIRQINEKIAHHIMPKICFVLLNPGCTGDGIHVTFFPVRKVQILIIWSALSSHVTMFFYLPSYGMAEFTSRFGRGHTMFKMCNVPHMPSVYLVLKNPNCLLPSEFAYVRPF